MKKNGKWMKRGLPLVILFMGFAGMKTIAMSGEQEEEKKEVDSRPTVKVETMQPTDHQITIVGHGEVKPLQSTVLSAQVSGEVTKWHENFVAGGIVKRGEGLFEIEKDAYVAALLQAEASLQSAKANLIEEQGRADVAKQEAKSLPSARVTDLYLRKPQLMSAKAAVKSAEAGLKIAQRDLDNCAVRAPFDALVVTRELGVGQYVNRGAAVAQLHSVEAAEVIFPIAGFDVAFLPESVKGVSAQVSTSGRYAMTRTGVVVRDTGVVDNATRMTNLVVQVEDPYSLNTNMPKLRFGNYVTVKFNGQKLNQVFELSQDFVNNNAIWLVEGDNKLVKRDVQVIREEGDMFVIGSGINANDRVVTTLPEYPQQGMEVKIAGLNDVAKSESDEQDNTITAKADVN
jgi:RND family efflux transporter MFP subunit